MIEKKQKSNTLGMGAASEYAHISRQALYIALRKGFLKASKEGKFWKFTEEDLDHYRANKYNPERRKVNGEKIYDFEGGIFNVQYASKAISAALNQPHPPQKIYYLFRMGYLRGYKKGSQWIIKKEDALAYCQKASGESPRQLRFA